MGRRSRRLAVGILAAAAVAAAATALAFRHDMSRARALADGSTQTLDSPWGAIQYAEVGEGPVVLMIHGSGGGFDQGMAFSERLRDEPVRLIAPSRFGYLGSSMPAQATPEAQADALAHLLRELGEDRAVIIGGSAGALSATQLALRHPALCRGLVLIAPAIFGPGRAPDTNPAPNRIVQSLTGAMLGSDFLFWLAVRLAPDAMTRLVLATDPALLADAPAAERRRVRDILFRILPVSARREGLLMDGSTAGSPRPYPLDELACPVLAIGIRDDLYGTAAAAEHAAALAPDARLVMYDQGGHVWVGHDEALWREVAGFVSALPEGAD